MSDKEPRRRKKRKDVQRKDDMRSEEPTSQKSDSRDSDQELEEEFVVPTHQPSQIAKVVFVLLFSGLVVSMSIVFLALQGAEKGPIDVFDGHHDHAVEHEETSVNLDEDAHSYNAVETAHEELEDLLPDIGSIFKFEFLDEKVEVPEASHTVEEISPSPTDKIHTTLNDFEDSEQDLSSTVNTFEQNILEEEPIEKEDVIEETIDLPPPAEAFTEAVTVEYQPDDTDNEDQDEIASMESSYIESTTEEPDTYTDPSTEEDFQFSSVAEPEDQIFPMTEDPVIDVSPSEVYEDLSDDISMYENMDISNREDYLIREEVDSIDKVLNKDLHQDNGDNEEEVDDDDDDDDENIQDEFDFWQF